LLHDKILARLFKASFTDLDNVPAFPTAITPRPVLIAGYGRFGQLIGRLLQANGIKATILDHDPKQIDFLRRFGWKVYYGDVMDMEILHSAGADTARILVLAIDDREKAITVAARIKERYPHLKIMARAYDRRHAYDLTKAGVDYYIRETFGSAMMMGEEILKSLGMRSYQAKNLTRKFARHDMATLRSSFEHFEDEKALVSFAIQSREELIKIFEEDRKDIEKQVDDDSWDTPKS
jgi:glutathione-regulated potassium-efflux system ancillary protein KefC